MRGSSRTKFALSVLLSVLAAVSLAAKRPSHVIETTIEAVNKDPVKFHNKTIRVRGIVDQCRSYSCNICSVAETADSADDGQLCLEASFSESGPPRADQVTSWASGQAEDWLEVLYRFSEITAEGHYDARCDVGFDPARPVPKDSKMKRIIVCTDRATTFTIERVVTVHRRIAAPETILHGYSGWPLIPASEEETKELQRVYRETRAAWDDASDDIRETAVFREQHEASDELWFCECLVDSCKNKWPTKGGHILLTPNNPYYCMGAKKLDGRWNISFAG
jgi:hypothetical protein